MNNVQVYITDNISVVELDTENLDFNSVFSISDIQDITARKDSVKSITLKGTKRNNEALGSLFDWSRTSDLNFDNALLFNYNPLRSVTCLVYEDGNLIFRGSLRVQKINIKNGNITYACVLTGSFIDFKTAIQDKLLSDIDFTDLKHHYNISAITSSWDTSLENYDVNTDTFGSQSFQYGKGYVYPMIDYGYYLTTSSDVNLLSFKNFKPAIYVREYLDRIFNQPSISGFSYEIKGSYDFVQRFNQMVIPDTFEGIRTSTTGFTSTYSQSLLITTSFSSPTYINDDPAFYEKLIPVNIIVPPPSTVGDFLTTHGAYSNVLDVLRWFNTTANVGLNITSNYHSNMESSITCDVALVKRDAEDNNSHEGWEVIKNTTFVVPNGDTDYSFSLNFDVAATDYEEGKQLGVMVRTPKISDSTVTWQIRNLSHTVSYCRLTIPKSSADTFNFELQPSTTGEIFTPQAPVNVKQTDFIKLLCQQLNMYVYSKPTAPKHLVFETYDSFYSYCAPQYIKQSALDWTNKIDYTNGFEAKSNIELPKSYLFTYKDDSDYLTDNYKKTYSSVYGSLNFTDNLGLIDQKKVELISSPLISATESGTNRKYPMLYKVEDAKKKPMKTNLRLGYYNGLQSCNEYSICYSSSGSSVPLYSGTSYPMISNYFVDGSGNVQSDLHFGQPVLFYFPYDSDYANAPTSYQDYFIGQITDLTNPDVTYIECNVLLNAIDIANLDLRIPVFIQTGKYNASYFKVLKVEYEGAVSPSKVSLQRIVF